MADKKSYGLFVPKKKPTLLLPSLSIFGDDDDEGGPASVGAELQRQGLKAKTKKQTQLEMQKALEDDPTVYEYDSIYDEMEKKKRQVKETKTEIKKPKYIESLLKTAEIRKREYERRIERKVHKEREAEGDEFADKEAFVTTAYRQKMEELQKIEDEEKRETALEAIGDVTKQKDLVGFYRHLMRARFDENIDNSQGQSTETKSTTDEKPIKTEKESSPENSDKETRSQTRIRSKRRSRDSSDDSDERGHGTSDRKRRHVRSNSRERVKSHRHSSDRRRSRSRSRSPRRRSNDESSSSSSRKDREREHSSNEENSKKEDGSVEENVKKEDAPVASVSEEASEKPKEKPNPADAKIMFARRNEDTSVLSARERYMQRKQLQTNVAVISSDAQ